MRVSCRHVMGAHTRCRGERRWCACTESADGGLGSQAMMKRCVATPYTKRYTWQVAGKSNTCTTSAPDACSRLPFFSAGTATTGRPRGPGTDWRGPCRSQSCRTAPAGTTPSARATCSSTHAVHGRSTAVHVNEKAYTERWDGAATEKEGGRRHRKQQSLTWPGGSCPHAARQHADTMQWNGMPGTDRFMSGTGHADEPLTVRRSAVAAARSSACRCGGWPS